MKQTLLNFGILYDHVPIKYDNIRAINIPKNNIQHFERKRIGIR